MDSFVYIWKNLTNGRQYIGYHKGSLNDGYICSSKNETFWTDFYSPEMKWERIIIFEGTSQECLEREQEILKNIDLNDPEYYNNARGASVIFSEEVTKKMSLSHKKRWELMDDEDRINFGKKISQSSTGIKRIYSEESKMKMKEYLSRPLKDRIGEEKAKEIGKKISEKNKGKKRSEETKLKMSESHSGEKNSMLGRKQSLEFIEKKRQYFLSENNPGKNKSEETKKKISESKKGKPSKLKGRKRNKIKCPHCGKEGGPGVMKRWHFENCKNIENDK